MNAPNVVGYPTPGKAKAKMLLDAFCKGAGGIVADRIPTALLPGPAAFYGVTADTEHLWAQAKEEGRDWYYIDNAYFDPCRETYFRITKNRLQHDGAMDESDGRRWNKLGLEFLPWIESKPNSHIVVCPASDSFMRIAGGYMGNWGADIRAELRRHTKREIRFRPWDANKGRAFKSLPLDLAGAHALVTYTSAAATTALRYGVPIFVTAEDCISRTMALSDLSKIETPYYPEYRERWAMVVADNQWTVEEMENGFPWRWMNPDLKKLPRKFEEMYA